MSNTKTVLSDSPLGKSVSYIEKYSPELLFAIPRQKQRDLINVSDPLPFRGVDIWNHYELSWLNTKGKPIVAIAQIDFDCRSPFLIESKSMKLYFNSFNQTQFSDLQMVQNCIIKDLSEKSGAPVKVTLWSAEKWEATPLEKFKSDCLDELDISIDTYTLTPAFLMTQGENIIEETVHSNLFKSNCLITGQPDWASIEISYQGKKINHEGLLRYIVSARNHNEFHEHCVERIFMDILRLCQPLKLTVYARYTRRGGIDINPFRTTEKIAPAQNKRLHRQ